MLREVLKVTYKMLIIDDDIELLKMLTSYFELKKYTVITAVKWHRSSG